MSTVPEGLDPGIHAREIVLDADIGAVTPLLERATMR